MKEKKGKVLAETERQSQQESLKREEIEKFQVAAADQRKDNRIRRKQDERRSCSLPCKISTAHKTLSPQETINSWADHDFFPCDHTLRMLT